MLNLLYVTRDEHPSFRADIADLFGNYLPRLGVFSTLVARQSGDAGDVPWAGGNVVTAPPPRGLFSRHVGGLLHDLRAVSSLAGQHDAVQVRNKILTGLAALVLARHAGRPFFYWMSFPFPEDDLLRVRIQGLAMGPLRLTLTFVRGHITRWVQERLLLPRCDHVFVQSERMRQDLMAAGLPEASMTPVPMCVDVEVLDTVQPDHQALPFASGARVLVYLGACDQSRNIEFLLDSLELVRMEEPLAVLLLVGDAVEATDRERLQTLILARNLGDAVQLTGWLPRSRALALAGAAEVGVCALPDNSVFNSMSPTKAVELMALGLPIVVTEHPDQGALVRAGRCGFCTAYDTGEFAQAVLSLLRDTDAARDMGQNGREHVRANRSYAYMAEFLAARYEALMAKHAAGGKP